MQLRFNRRTVSFKFRECLISVAFIFASILPVEGTQAWGFVGHRIICAVAFNDLSKEAQAEVNQLIRAFAKPNGKRFKEFSASCAFADTARHNARDETKSWRHYKRFDRWHYLNLPRTTLKLSWAAANCRKDCVLDAITYHGEKFADTSLQAADRGEALIFLAHWIADIHQPLHVGFADDRGGSEIDVVPAKRFGGNLHRAWDSALLKRARGKRKLPQYLRDIGRITSVDKAAWRREQDPLQWAAESYLIATSKQTGYCAWTTSTKRKSQMRKCRRPLEAVKIDEAYVAKNIPVLERRLQQAAIRLARRIENLLEHP